MKKRAENPLVAIACGGTGGHLFPGMAVAEALRELGFDCALLVSAKEIDHRALEGQNDFLVHTLPSVGLAGMPIAGFVTGFLRSFKMMRGWCRAYRPAAVLAMGGFTSAAPLMAGRFAKIPTFIHEANAFPGRANRWFAPWVDIAFTGFPSAATRLASQSVQVTGTPARPLFRPMDHAAARLALGLKPNRPVLLVTGGSQGARGLNQGILSWVAQLVQRVPDLQVLHLAGSLDFEATQNRYVELGVPATVKPFLTEMDLALGAATLVISRAGASSSAEYAAMRVPTILVPYPAAADDHQTYNAAEYAHTGAAIVVKQTELGRPATLELVVGLLSDLPRRTALAEAMSAWHSPYAAKAMALAMQEVILERLPNLKLEPLPPIEEEVA